MARTYLTAPLTLYVAPTGDDSWAGDAQNPLKHIQYAVNKIADDYDCGPYQPTVQLIGGGPAYGNGGVYFNEAIELPAYVAGSLRTTHTNPIIRGDPSHPEYHIIYSAALNGIFAATRVPPWTLDGFAIYNDGTACCLLADNIATLYYRNLIFGPALAHVKSIINSGVVMCGPCKANAGAQCHLWAEAGGQIAFQPGWNVTLEGNPGFTWFARAQNQGMVTIAPNTGWIGTAQGSRGYADWHGGIQTWGIGLPGNTAAITANGGWVN